MLIIIIIVNQRFKVFLKINLKSYKSNVSFLFTFLEEGTKKLIVFTRHLTGLTLDNVFRARARSNNHYK